MEICEETVQTPMAWFSKRWWKQERLDLAGARAAVGADGWGGYGERE